MPQARRIEPRAHGDGHLWPGVAGEMETWGPGRFARARGMLAACEACQACLFCHEGADVGHLHGTVIAALAEASIQPDLRLIAEHLECCLSCRQALLDAEIALADGPEADDEPGSAYDGDR